MEAVDPADEIPSLVISDLDCVSSDLDSVSSDLDRVGVVFASSSVCMRVRLIEVLWLS